LRIFCGRFYKYAAPTALEKKRDATMANVPPLARAVLVLMGFNMIWNFNGAVPKDESIRRVQFWRFSGCCEL